MQQSVLVPALVKHHRNILRFTTFTTLFRPTMAPSASPTPPTASPTLQSWLRRAWQSEHPSNHAQQHVNTQHQPNSKHQTKAQPVSSIPIYLGMTGELEVRNKLSASQTDSILRTVTDDAARKQHTQDKGAFCKYCP